MYNKKDETVEERQELIAQYAFDWTLKVFCAWGAAKIFTHFRYASSEHEKIKSNSGRGGNPNRVTAGQFWNVYYTKWRSEKLFFFGKYTFLATTLVGGIVGIDHALAFYRRKESPLHPLIGGIITGGTLGYSVLGKSGFRVGTGTGLLGGAIMAALSLTHSFVAAMKDRVLEEKERLEAEEEARFKAQETKIKEQEQNKPPR